MKPFRMSVLMRTGAVTLCLCLLLCSLSGCKSSSGDSSSESSASSSSAASSSETSSESSEASSESSAVSSESSAESSEESSQTSAAITNPLTGEEMDAAYVSSRPVAFMINNIEVAVPQCGVSDADIIYEAIVEGGITRLMCIFQHIPDDTVVGSVRSLRHSYIDFAMTYDAIIAHCGGASDALDRISSLGYSDIEAISWAGNLFYRDSWRMENMGYEHSLMTTGSAINNYLANDASYRTTYEDGFSNGLSFSEDPQVSGGEVKTDIDVDFGLGKHTYFSYDASANDYTAEEYGSAWIDDNTGESVHVKNVVVLQTEVWTMSDGVHMDMTLTGTGNGWFMVNGTMAPITWSRADENSPFVYTYTDGTPVEFGIGPSYICVISAKGGVS